MGKIIKDFRDNFTIIHNDIINDERLHLKTLGLFMYLWRQPADWNFYLREVTNHHVDGVDATRGAIKELERYGYLTRVRDRNEKGQFGDSDWVLTDQPDPNTDRTASMPKSENPTQDISTQEDPTLLSTNVTKDRLTKKNNNGAPKSPNSFELYESITGKQLNSIQQAKFVDWIGRLGNELVIHAIKYAQSKNSPNFGFIDSVLNEWEKSRTDNNKISVVDVASANAYQAVRQRKLEKRIQANHYRTTNKPKKEGKEDGARW